MSGAWTWNNYDPSHPWQDSRLGVECLAAWKERALLMGTGGFYPVGYPLGFYGLPFQISYPPLSCRPPASGLINGIYTDRWMGTLYTGAYPYGYPYRLLNTGLTVGSTTVRGDGASYLPLPLVIKATITKWLLDTDGLPRTGVVWVNPATDFEGASSITGWTQTDLYTAAGINPLGYTAYFRKPDGTFLTCYEQWGYGGSYDYYGQWDEAAAMSYVHADGSAVDLATETDGNGQIVGVYVWNEIQNVLNKLTKLAVANDWAGSWERIGQAWNYADMVTAYDAGVPIWGPGVSPPGAWFYPNPYYIAPDWYQSVAYRIQSYGNVDSVVGARACSVDWYYHTLAQTSSSYQPASTLDALGDTVNVADANYHLWETGTYAAGDPKQMATAMGSQGACPLYIDPGTGNPANASWTVNSRALVNFAVSGGFAYY